MAFFPLFFDGAAPAVPFFSTPPPLPPGGAPPPATGLRQLAVGATGWGGDLILTATGDLLVLEDSPDNPAASLQLLTRIILTTPLVRDTFGNPVARPDDLFNTQFGSGIREAIGEPLTPDLAARITSAIRAAIVRHPTFAANPPPTVQSYIDGTGDGQLYIAATATTIIGQTVVFPPTAIQ